MSAAVYFAMLSVTKTADGRWWDRWWIPTCVDGSKRHLSRGTAATRLLGLWVRIPTGAWLSVSCECCVQSGSGRCNRPITRPEETYRVCVRVCACARAGACA